MLVKFLARGTGSARDAAGYLLGERHAAGKTREGVEVLRGDPHQVAAVADTLPFEHKYTSGVIAWAPEDQPTDEQIGAVLDAFNHEHGWSRPDDPARARVEQPGHRAYIEAARLRAGLRLESSPRDLIRDYLLQPVEHGTVRNRHEVVATLREAGLEVPRQGKDYLTALDPETGNRWRLKGELYGVDFQRERFDRAAAEAAGERAQGDRGVDRERARTARRELAARREERAQYHRVRYGSGDRADARVAGQGVAPALRRRPGSLARHLRRKLGDDALPVDAHRSPDPDGRRRARPGHRARPGGTLALLEVDTWGIALREIESESFSRQPKLRTLFAPFTLPLVSIRRSLLGLAGRRTVALGSFQPPQASDGSHGRTWASTTAR